MIKSGVFSAFGLVHEGGTAFALTRVAPVTPVFMITPLRVLLVVDGDVSPYQHALEQGGYNSEITQIPKFDDLDDALEDDDWDIAIAKADISALDEISRAVKDEQPDLPLIAVGKTNDASLLNRLAATISTDDMPSLSAIVARVLRNSPSAVPSDSTSSHSEIATERRAEERCHILAELSADLAFSLDADANGQQRISWVSDSFARETGYTKDELGSMGGMLAIVHADHHDKARTVLSVSEATKTDQADFPIMMKSGAEKWMAARSVAKTYSGSGATTVYCSLQDITARKVAENELVVERDQAQEMARMKSAFLSNMSHEIRTPLTGLLGFAGLLSEETEGEAQEFAQSIERSGQRLLDTLNSVLDLARIEGEKPDADHEPFDVVEEIEQVVELLQPVAEQKGITLHLSQTAGPIEAKIDKTSFGRILTNLIGNGIKFTEEGGVDVDVAADGDSISLVIRDSGIGIDEEFLPQLFDEFRQESTGASSEQRGTGLGLAICKKLADILGATISVESERPGGTTFTVIIPGAVRAESAEADASPNQSIEPVITTKAADENVVEAETVEEEADQSEAVSTGSVESAPDSPTDRLYNFDDLVEAEDVPALMDAKESEASETSDLAEEPGVSETADEVESRYDASGFGPKSARFEFDAQAAYTSQDEAKNEKVQEDEPVAEAESEGAVFQAVPEEFEPATHHGDSLPETVVAEEEAPSEPEDATPGWVQDDRPAVLVVEDNPDTRMLLERILKRTYRVQAVGDARSALVLLNEHHFDGFVLDINLGGKETGVDILRISRTLPGYRNVFALALTAYALPGDRERFLAAGFNKYVSKPFTRSALMAALKDGLPVVA